MDPLPPPYLYIVNINFSHGLNRLAAFMSKNEYRVLYPSQTFASQSPPISRKAKIMGDIIRLVFDLHVEQVSENNSLMAVSERQMSGKGCSVREA